MRNVVVIEGCRTPFLKSGTDYMDFMTYELGGFAIKGLLDKTGIKPSSVDRVILGNVISTLATSNVAREAALAAGIPNTTHCDTVTQACISANRAIASAVADIATGQSDIIIAGGVDSPSETPIGYKRKMQKKLFRAQKNKTFLDHLIFALSLSPKSFAPERPQIAEFTTKRTMGQDCDILAAAHGVSREEQDDFALRSHKLAGKAYADGHLPKEVVPVKVGDKTISKDNGIREDSTIEKLNSLRPAFNKESGTLTAANSSFLTDGSAVVLLMSEDKAKSLGLKPKARIHDYAFSGQDLETELLLGPTYATSKLLEKTNKSLDDFDVIEFHEAFAGQILANVKCLASDAFAKENLGREKAVGTIDMDKFNSWGGSLSIGHPFGATGARLLTTVMNRLEAEDGKLGLLAACAAGAHGHAMIVERI